MSGNAEAQPVDVACAVKQEDEQASSAHGKPLPDQVNALLRKVATAKGAAFVPVQDLASLRCSVDLDSQCQAVMTLQTVEAMDEHKSLMKKLIGAANQLRESVAKAASKMTGHLDNIEREVLRSEKKEAGRKEKEAVAKAKAMAKKAAQDVQKVATEVPALFAIERSKLVIVLQVQIFIFHRKFSNLHDEKISAFSPGQALQELGKNFSCGHTCYGIIL